MEESRLKRISELTKIARERELTDEEKKEREELRNEYRQGFRLNLQNSLESTYIVDDKGNKIKVHKVQDN